MAVRRYQDRRGDALIGLTSFSSRQYAGDTMAKTDFKSVNEYIASKPKDVQAILKLVRGAIRKAVPEATEGISYQIPAYKLNGTALLFFAGWKQHFSLYPASDAMVGKFKKELANYEISKGTIRFPFSEAVPVD